MVGVSDTGDEDLDDSAAYRHGRMRVQLIAQDGDEADILQRLASLAPSRRQSIMWTVLKAGVQSLTATGAITAVLPPVRITEGGAEV